jgi:PKD repeat protein
LDGSGSSDPDSDPLTYAWDFGDGATGTGQRPSHAYATAGAYTVKLTVNDGLVNSAVATTTVTVIPSQSPIANPGGPYTAQKNIAMTLNGSASSDADGDALTYSWDFGDGKGGIGAKPSHVYTAAGTYTVTLTVNDGQVNSAPASTTVTVINQPPVANAGPDQTVTQRATVTLNGAASSDPDGAIAQFAWRQISGTAVTLSGANIASPRFTAPAVKTTTPVQLVFELTVTDNDGATATDQVVITVVK